MKSSTNGTHPPAARAGTNAQENAGYANGSVARQYPDSQLASLLDSQLAHRTLKYGVEAVSFAVINLFFPKRTTWVARVALPLAVNYVLGKFIEDNYDAWVASLAHREEKKKAGSPAAPAPVAAS